MSGSLAVFVVPVRYGGWGARSNSVGRIFNKRTKIGFQRVSDIIMSNINNKNVCSELPRGHVATALHAVVCSCYCLVGTWPQHCTPWYVAVDGKC